MSGIDDKGSKYASIQEMWEAELNNKGAKGTVVQPVGSKDNWYNNANSYWSKSEATNNGVLGGYGHLSALDIKFSLGFLLGIVKRRPAFRREFALDCGAGIGRISKDLLCQTFKTVDLVDQCDKLIAKAREDLKEKKGPRHFWVQGLQKFEFAEQYDCVWVQWVFGHLSDQDAVAFLGRAKQSLRPGGIIVLKENHCSQGFVVDKEDFSVTRSTPLYKDLFSKAGLQVIAEQTQQNWPNDLFGVRMYALE